jgi:hypothetical protein
MRHMLKIRILTNKINIIWKIKRHKKNKKLNKETRTNETLFESKIKWISIQQKFYRGVNLRDSVTMCCVVTNSHCC